MRFKLQHIIWLITLVCVASSCHPQRSAHTQAIKPSIKTTSTTLNLPPHTSTISYKQERRFNELFLEAIRQKEADHIDAEYELLDAALKLNPNASEAIYEMGLLKLSYSSFSDTLSRAQGDSLRHKAVRIDNKNVYYKEALATYLANSAK